ncbi:MAG: hypothetical protein A2Y75_01195 [Candidatus Solincola sediminis]|uniref:ABM domain-containing protein n=1 Tax=Candidatus Solincola sediminis TaxID=1797199 RepID=A0A1F2WRS0_9ACTN|nr:MAG: hypothetical protein A2Y75_01195 [Candidatus Solincola sediminis]
MRFRKGSRPGKEGNMEARVIKVLIDVYRVDEAIKIYGECVAPAVKLREGGVGALLLGDRSSGRGFSITLWENKEKLIEAQESGFMQEQIAKFASMFIGTPDIEALEVMVKDL